MHHLKSEKGISQKFNSTSAFNQQFSGGNSNGIQALWDIRLFLDVTALGSTLANAGVCYAKGNYFFSAWNAADQFSLVDSLGQFQGEITIAGVGAVRGMTFDGTFIYAGNNTTAIQVINPVTRQKVRQFTVPTTVGNVRWITFNPAGNNGQGSFYVGNFDTDIFQINKPTGTTAFLINSIPAATHGLTGMYGVAYQPNGANSKFWAFDQGQVESAAVILELDASGIPTGTRRNLETDLPNGATGVQAGGAFFASRLPGFPNSPSLLAMGQNGGMIAYDLNRVNFDVQTDSINLNNYLSAWPKSIPYSVRAGGRVRNVGASSTGPFNPKFEFRNLDNDALIQSFTGVVSSISPGSNANIQSPVINNSLYNSGQIYYAQGISNFPSDANLSNDTLGIIFGISDSTLARDLSFFDPTIAGSIGIGAAANEQKALGNKFSIPVQDTITSVTYLLAAPYAGQTSSISIYNMNGTAIGASPVRTSSIYTATPADEVNGVLVTVPVNPPLIVPAGDFFVALNELGDSTAGLGNFSSVYIPNTFFVKWNSFNNGDWAALEEFGATFKKPFSIYPNFGNRKATAVVSLPTVTTNTVSAITTSTAISGGNVTAAGGGVVTQRGVVWGTSSNPTIANPTRTVDGSGTGPFTSNITGLLPGTTYFLRAYATNSAGTSYGVERIFSTLSSSTNTLNVIFRVDANDFVNLGGILVNGQVSIAGFFNTRGGDLPDWTPSVGAMANIGNNVFSKAVTFSGPNVSSDSLEWKYVQGTDWADGDEGNDWFPPIPVNCVKRGSFNNRKFLLPPSGTLIISSKWAECPTITSTPFINTSTILGITSNSATGGGSISTDGGFAITARGVVWSTNPNPTIALPTKTNNGTGTGVFSSNISGLLPSTTYYARAYATNSLGTAYGLEVQFSTLGAASIPTLTTIAPSNIGQTSAQSGGDITADGGALVNTRGVCWSTIPNPTIALPTKTSDGTGTGIFSSNMSGLQPGTTYFVRAFATNIVGTAYGNEVSFTTSSIPVLPPTVVTSIISGISEVSALSGGSVTSDGGGQVTARGVCWSTSSNPNVSLATKTIDGIGTGTFNSNLTGLLPSTLYYVAAYATNSAGTSYGAVRTFTTLACNFLSPISGGANVLTCINPGTTLSVSGGVSYLWSNGSTGPALLINPATTTTYSVISIGAAGCPDTASVTVIVNNTVPPNPLINNGASVGSFCVGGSLLLNSSASIGNEWFLNGIPVSGTNQTYLATQVGSYSVKVTDPVNGCFSTSSPFVTSVLPTPTISTEPVNQIIVEGQNAQFSVLVNPPGATYKWQLFNGGIFVDLSNSGQFSGVETNTLNVSNVTISGNNGQLLRCLAIVGPCADTSQSAALTVITNVNGLKSGNEISLFPNPASSSLFFKGIQNSGEVILLDFSGREVLKTKIISGQGLNISHLSAGFYVWRVSSETGLFSGKFLKE